MADTSSSLPLDIEEQVARIRRAREDSETFVAEQRKSMAEAQEIDRDRTLAPWQVALSGMAAGAAFFGAGPASSS